MRVLIVSDSHGLRKELQELKNFHEDVDLFIHCGDSELSPQDPVLEGFEIVQGNCDFNGNFPNQLLLNAQDHKIFVTHGHLYQVKSNLLNLHYKAQEMNANIVCFGHSHLLGVEKIDKTLFINPGSIRLPRGRKEKTYVIIDIEKDRYIIRVYEFLGKELKELQQNIPF